MARTVRPRLALLFLAAVLPLGARKAHAWTEARVTTAAATLTVDGAGAADVDLELGVSIDAGWLEGLEIAGLDPDLVLDPAFSVLFVSEEGERFTPEMRPLGDGRVLLAFARRDAPRRGRYRTRLRYHTELGGRSTTPTGQGTVRFEWTLPGWQSGLDGVSIQIVAPPGATLPPEETSAQSTIRSDVRTSADGTLLTLRRAHLPRTLPWVVAFEVPEAAVAPALRGPRAHAALPPPQAAPKPHEPDLPRSTELLVALFALAGIGKRLAYERALRLRGAAPRPLVPIGSAAHALVVLAAAASAVWLGRRGLELFPLPLFGILLLSLQRPVGQATAPRLGGFRPVRREHLTRARRARVVDQLAPLRWLDASHPLGLVITALCVAALLATSNSGEGQLSFTPVHGAALFFALMLTTPASRLPSTPELRLAALVRLAERLRVPLAKGAPAMALRLLVHEDSEGRAQDARLRVCTERRPDGLLRLDIIRLDRDGLGGHRGGHALLVVTRAGTAAERLLAGALPRLPVQRAPAGRRARIGSITTDLEQLLAALATADSAARGVQSAERVATAGLDATARMPEPRLAS